MFQDVTFLLLHAEAWEMNILFFCIQMKHQPPLQLICYSREIGKIILSRYLHVLPTLASHNETSQFKAESIQLQIMY